MNHGIATLRTKLTDLLTVTLDYEERWVIAVHPEPEVRTPYAFGGQGVADVRVRLLKIKQRRIIIEVD